MRQLAPDESEHDTRALEAEALEGWPQETPFISTTAGLAEESFELVESKEEFGALSGPDGQPEHERPVVQGPAGTAPAVRILWPALGFPAVIAPGAAPPPGASGPHVARSATVLLLSNRETLTSADAARYLRVVPWEQRTRAYIPERQPGCFAATDLRVRTDSPAGVLTRSQTDGRGDAISFGGDRYEDSIVGSLSKAVCSFYARQNLRCLHEVRISEQACAKLADGQYHLFWNGDPTAPEAQLEEMNLLINHFAIPNRRALAVPERERDWLRKNFSGLIDEYQFDYGTLHPPYKPKDPRKRLTQVLHPLVVRRQLVQRANRSLTFAHVTDTHVNVRDDVYEENLRRAEQPMSWDGRQLRYRGIPLRHNNFNRSFERVYAEAKRGADVILVTGDLIDYPRGHIGLMSGGQHRHRLGEDWPYHADRNWFLYYYLLASGANYTAPVYTILGNHDWRLNPYSPFAPGTPSRPTLAHNYLDFPDEGQLKDILRHAHGPGHDTKFAYSELGAARLAKAIAGYFTGALDFYGSHQSTSELSR